MLVFTTLLYEWTCPLAQKSIEFACPTKTFIHPYSVQRALYINDQNHHRTVFTTTTPFEPGWRRSRRRGRRRRRWTSASFCWRAQQSPSSDFGRYDSPRSSKPSWSSRGVDWASLTSNSTAGNRAGNPVTLGIIIYNIYRTTMRSASNSNCLPAAIRIWSIMMVIQCSRNIFGNMDRITITINNNCPRRGFWTSWSRGSAWLRNETILRTQRNTWITAIWL